MCINIHNSHMQDDCFRVLRLLNGRCGPGEANRIEEETFVGALADMARPTAPGVSNDKRVEQGDLPG